MRWQATWQADPSNVSVSYWGELRRRIGPPTLTGLDFMRPDARHGTVARGASISLPQQHLEIVGAVAKERRTTPIVVRLAALASVLRDACRIEVIPIRVTVPARPPGFENTLGWFAHDVVAYIPTHERSFDRFVRVVHETWFGVLPTVYMPMRAVGSSASSHYRVSESSDIAIAVNDRTRCQYEDVEPFHDPDGHSGTERGLRPDFTGPSGRFISCHYDPCRFSSAAIATFLEALAGRLVSTCS